MMIGSQSSRGNAPEQDDLPSTVSVYNSNAVSNSSPSEIIIPHGSPPPYESPKQTTGKQQRSESQTQVITIRCEPVVSDDDMPDDDNDDELVKSSLLSLKN